MRPLEPGDIVRLVSPSGPAEPERVTRGVELLSGWGLTVERGESVLGRHGFFGGTDDARLRDLDAALADPSVRAVVCTRGGYGVQRIVDRVRFGAPKHIVGFSDITALQLAAWRFGRWPAVHGPGAAWLDSRLPLSSEDSLRRALMTASPLPLRRDPAAETGPVVVPGGPVEGVLLGGNLTMLTSTIGTADMPDLAGAILLLEDVDEAPYRVDRMLTQLSRSSGLRGVQAVAVGQFTNCAGRGGVSVADVLLERLAPLGVPVLGGLPVGHGPGQETVVLGAPAVLDVTAGTLVSRAAPVA
ncbi:S66 peptidase family protein [Dactylosporangium sp. CA-092794]|uniref:S66 peptidase family protein n=1 Tax=Dactylosporangium sp. CA-092794 TaxID=3239929 RepID=UPI003D8A140D